MEWHTRPPPLRPLPWVSSLEVFSPSSTPPYFLVLHTVLQREYTWAIPIYDKIFSLLVLEEQNKLQEKKHTQQELMKYCMNHGNGCH